MTAEAEHKLVNMYRSISPLKDYVCSTCSCGWSFYPHTKNALSRMSKVRSAFRKHLKSVAEQKAADDTAEVTR